MHCFCPWKASRAAAHLSQSAGGGSGFPWSGESHGSLGGQLIASSSVPCSRPELYSLTHYFFRKPSLWRSPFFSRCWRGEEDAGAIKLTLSRCALPPPRFPVLAICYLNVDTKYKGFSLKSTSQIQRSLASGNSANL